MGGKGTGRCRTLPTTHGNGKAEARRAVPNADRLQKGMEEKRQIKQMGIDERQLVVPGKDDDSTAQCYSARDNLCEHTAKVNLLFILKLFETSVKIGHNCNSLKYHGKNKQSMFCCETKSQKSEI